MLPSWCLSPTGKFPPAPVDAAYGVLEEVEVLDADTHKDENAHDDGTRGKNTQGGEIQWISQGGGGGQTRAQQARCSFSRAADACAKPDVSSYNRPLTSQARLFASSGADHGPNGKEDKRETIRRGSLAPASECHRRPGDHTQNVLRISSNRRVALNTLILPAGRKYPGTRGYARIYFQDISALHDYGKTRNVVWYLHVGGLQRSWYILYRQCRDGGPSRNGCVVNDKTQTNGGRYCNISPKNPPRAVPA